MYKKRNIPQYNKEQVWKLCCHPSDYRVAQCATCESLVKGQFCILQKYNYNNELLPYKVNGTAEYGHIISEFNGGGINIDNLTIQCKTCNSRLGKNNIDLNIKIDQIMINKEDINNTPDLTRCTYICKNGFQCKKKKYPNRERCHIHLTF
jgi:hypothetical protein